MGYIKEDSWVCSSCGHKNRGRDTDCAQCGSPKEEDEKYAGPDAGSEIVTDPELLKLARAGANRTCPYCGADVREGDESCNSCGATRNEHRDEAGEDDVPPADKPPEPPPLKHEEPDPVPKRPFNWRAALIVLGCMAAVGGLIWLGVWLFAPWEVEATVADATWEHAATLRQKTLMHGEGWESDMPAGTFNRSCETRQNGTEDCNPHDCNPHPVDYECNPHQCNPQQVAYDCNPHPCNCREVCTPLRNGFSECDQHCDTCYDTCYRTEYDTCYDTCTRTEYDTCYDQCPVYAEWCRYDYHEWPVIDSGRTTGTGHDVAWPPLSANGPDQRLEKAARYEVRFSDGEKGWDYRPDGLADYNRFPLDGRWRIKVNRAGQVWPLRPLD